MCIEMMYFFLSGRFICPIFLCIGLLITPLSRIYQQDSILYCCSYSGVNYLYDILSSRQRVDPVLRKPFDSHYFRMARVLA